MSKFLVFDVGCIECGEESRPVGLYESREQAEAAIKSYLLPEEDWGQPECDGQPTVEIFEVDW